MKLKAIAVAKYCTKSLLRDSKSLEKSSVFRTEQIRQIMLDSLDYEGWKKFSQLERCILVANGVDELWHLRSDLMFAISSILGESIASQKIRQLTRMFEGLMPSGLTSRLGPLSN